MITAEQVRKLLSNRFVQWNLKQLAKRDKNGRTRVDAVLCAAAGLEKAKLSNLPYTIIFGLLPKIVKVDKKELVEVYSHRRNRRAIANVARSVSTLGLSTPQKFTSPILIVWNFTNACNLTCKHCYQNARKALPDEMTLEERLALIDQMVANDLSALAIAGGEPLIHKDFWPVAEYAHKNGIYLAVATNGTLITKEVAKRLVDVGVDYVEISVDSGTPAIHDAFRGGEGNWQRAVDGVKNAVEAGLNVGIATTATRRGYSEMKELIELSKELKVNSFYAFNFIPTGRGKAITDDDLPPETREEMLALLYKTFMEKDVFAFSTCPQYGRFCYESNPDDAIVNSHYGYLEGQQAKMLADYIGGCGAGRLYCAVQPDGKVTPCVFMPKEVVGDLRKNSLAEIWQNSQVMDALRDRSQLKGHCGKCEFRSMCGGCRARAYGYFGDYQAPDPGCKFNKDAWEELVAQHTVHDDEPETQKEA